MANVVFDKLAYFMSYENDVLIEGYDGFKIEENNDGTLFVIYREIVDNKEYERRFVLPDGSMDLFMDLSKRFSDFFERQRHLFQLMIEAEQHLDAREEEALKEVCNGIYQIPENYVGFVAMNLTKTQFFNMAKERILNSIEPNLAA